MTIYPAPVGANLLHQVDSDRLRRIEGRYKPSFTRRLMDFEPDGKYALKKADKGKKLIDEYRKVIIEAGGETCVEHIARELDKDLHNVQTAVGRYVAKGLLACTRTGNKRTYRIAA